jgi:hypothetical protein
MSTVAEIEEAIDALPLEQQSELAEWMDSRRFQLASARAIFQMYDREEDEMEQKRQAGKTS